jgi:mannose-6-phosphate isomerase-like protein (cupin superfamily)
MNVPARRLHIGAGEGRRRRVLAAEQEIKAGEDAGLQFGMFYSSFPPGAGMPYLHLHRSHDEAFFVIEGELQFQLGSEEVRARPGSAVLVPRGTPHCFRNVGMEPVRWLVITAPASGITMIEKAGSVTPDDFDRMVQLYAEFDSEVLERHPHWDA